MSPLERTERTVLAALIALALFGGTALPLLLLDAGVPAALLPLALVAGALCAVRARIDPAPAGRRAPRWLSWTIAALLAVVATAIAFGALATPSRHWDGAVAWDLRAHWLGRAPTLAQPFFADPAVLSPARDYPLLQPLLVAAGNSLLGDPAGRAMFPAVFVLFGALLGTAVRRATGSTALAWLVAGAALLTPALAGPTSGGADSGYGDLLLLACTTAIAAGLATQDGRLVFLGAVLAVLTKPEGLPYAVGAAGVLFVTGERALLRAAAAGVALAGAIWLPVQQRLAHGPEAVAAIAFVPPSLWLVLELLDAGARRASLRAGARAVVAAALAAGALGAAWWLRDAIGGTVRAYFGGVGDPLGRLGRLPAVVAGAANYGLLRGNFGLAFWAALLGVAAAARRRALRPLLPLAAFVAVGLVLAFVPFVLSPEIDLQHHLRSSMPRLLLHWLGPALLLGAAAIGAASPPTTDARPAIAAAR